MMIHDEAGTHGEREHSKWKGPSMIKYVMNKALPFRNTSMGYLI